MTTKDSDKGGVAGKASDKVSSKNPVNRVGNGVKGLFNKGKGLFKKDKTADSGKGNKKSDSKSVDDGSKPEK